MSGNDTLPPGNDSAPIAGGIGTWTPLQDFEFALGILSLIGSYVIIMSFLILKEIRRHPFSLVFFLSLSDFFFVLIIILKEALNDDICLTPHGPGGFCVGTFVLHFFGMASVSWGAMMSVKLAINTLRPFASTGSYEKFFHMCGSKRHHLVLGLLLTASPWSLLRFVWAISLITALISWVRQDGSIDADRCEKAQDKQERVHAEFFAPLIVYFFVSVAAFGFALARMRTLAQASNYRNKILFRMAAYVIAIPVCWLGPLVYRAFLFFTTYTNRSIDTCEGLNAWKTISLCLLGLVNASIWLSTPDFLQAIQTRMKRCCKKDDGEDEPLISSDSTAFPSLGTLATVLFPLPNALSSS